MGLCGIRMRGPAELMWDLAGMCGVMWDLRIAYVGIYVGSCGIMRDLRVSMWDHVEFTWRNVG